MIPNKFVIKRIPQIKHKVVFLRHGESEYNLMNRFTGWQDVKITKKGYREARDAGKLMREHEFQFDLAYTSVLQRAIYSYYAIANELDCHWIPHHKDWRLNEKHYGSLQGLKKDEPCRSMSVEDFHFWRSSYDIPPPALSKQDFRHPIHDKKYKDIDKSLLPSVETLKDTVARVIPFWYDVVCKEAMQNKQILIVSHKNTLRGFFQHIEGINSHQIKRMKVPNAKPIVYEFDANMEYINNYTLGQQDEQHSYYDLPDMIDSNQNIQDQSFKDELPKIEQHRM